MTAFMFWNVNSRPRGEIIANLARRHDVDVIMLAECSISPAALLSELNRVETQYHYAEQRACKKIEIYSRFPGDFIPPIIEDDRLTVRHLQLPGLTDILLAVVHFPSKLWWSDHSQAAECCQLTGSLEEAENMVGHSRTVLVGDLNMNPFEAGVVGANGLHGVMTKRIAETGSRIVQGRQYQFFYNPMWSLLGDASPGPPGTHFYSAAEHAVFFWNMFDQVLIRPALLDRFRNKDLRIIESDDQRSFLSPRTGNPDPNVASDHLPLVFSLDL
ncbi:MAG: endonuclease/exonuclease/phosphatase family protein [Desulfomonile tiedjei]|nr:endonuclease/exonuclease/phosphatase family protein [Desulfomonile tiedjei]